MDQTKQQDTGYTSISVHKEDKSFYEQISAELTKELGANISVPQALKIGMTFYNQRRNFVKVAPRDESGKFTKQEQS